jgi:hypothetical protein
MWRNHTVTDLGEKSKKYQLYVTASFWLGQIFGILSLIAFAYGCFLVQAAIIH